MSEEIRSYNSIEKSASTGIKLLIIEVIAIIVFIIGIFVALAYFGIFNVSNLFTSPPEKEKNVIISDENQDKHEENRKLPISLDAPYVEDAEIKYVLKATVDRIEEKEDRYIITFDSEFPQIPISTNSWVSKYVDGKASQVKISDIQQGDTIKLVPRYSLEVEDWLLYDTIPLSATNSATK